MKFITFVKLIVLDVIVAIVMLSTSKMGGAVVFMISFLAFIIITIIIVMILYITIKERSYQ